MEHVQQLKSGRLAFRRAFPKDLQGIIGRLERVVSLKAKSLSEAGAMERFRAASDAYDLTVSAARKALAGVFDELDAPRIAFLAESHKANILAEDERQRIIGSVDRDRHEANELGFRSDLEECSGSQIRDLFEDDAVALGAAHGWYFDVRSESFSRLCRELLKASIAATEIQLARNDGAIVETPVAMPLSQQSGGRAKDASTPRASFVALARAALDRPAFGFSATTKQAVMTACRFFEEVHGELAPREIKRADVAHFIDLLAKCPAKRAFSERTWPLPKLVEAYEGKPFDGLSVKTMKQHVAMLSALWTRLQNVGQIPEGAPNPFARHSFPKVRRSENEGFTLPEVQTIFDLPLFTSGERPDRFKGEALFWIPWFLLWTGARPEEIAQLLVTDLVRDEESGQWTMTITDEGEHPRKGRRRLKTEGARRTFPIPSFLLQIGLPEYRAWLVDQGETALFPKLGTKGERNELFGGFTESWGKYLRAHGALPVGKRPAREFRHTWNTEARRKRISEEAREYMMGHSRAHRGQNANYGARNALGDEIHAVTFDKLDLTRVRRWEAPPR